MVAFLDDFNRADGAVGNGWTVQTGVAEVNGNALRQTGGTLTRITRDLGNADGLFYFEIAVDEALTTGLVLRWIDSANHVRVVRTGPGNFQLLERVGAVNTVVLSVTGAGALFAARLEGQDARIYSVIGGVLTERGTTTLQALFTGQAVHGIELAGSSTVLRLDNYRFANLRRSVADTFTRADSAVALGGDWTVHAGTGGIDANRAYAVATVLRATVELGDPDVEVEVEVPVTGNPVHGLLIRYIDANNYVTVRKNTAFGNATVDQVVAGVSTQLADIALAGSSPIRVRVVGNTLRWWTGGVDRGTVTIDAALAASTRFGITSDTTAARFDNFTATPIVLADGASTTTGAAAAVRLMPVSGAGASTTTGAAAAVRLMPVSAAGASTSAGAATAAIAKVASATGASTTAGTAAALVDRRAAATGASTTAGTAAAFVDRRAAASGASTTTGAAAGVIALTAAASGASTTAGAVAGALVRSAVAAGASTTAGSGAALLLLRVAASGASTTAGAAAPNLALVIVAAGASTTAGLAAALLRLMASASGASTTAGALASFLPRRSAPTITQVLDLDVGQVQASFAFVLVDATGVEIGRLSSLQAASLNHSTTRRVYRRLDDLQIPPSEQADVNPSADRVMVGMVVAGLAKGELGHVDTPLPWGEYVFDDRPREVESWGELWHGSLLDTTALLDDGLPVSVTYPAGYSLKTALAEQFELALFDRYDIEIPDYLTFGAPVSATVGTSRLEFMRAIAALGACGLWMANSRRGRVARIPVGDGHTPELAYEDGRNILRSSILLNDSKLRAPNRWVVQDTAQGSTTVGVWDLPASAENSAANRGRVITAPVRTVQGIPGSSTVERQANANAMAQADSVRDARAALTASCDGAIDPRHDTFDYVSLLATVYVEHAWSAKLDTGEAMSHELRVTYA